MSDKDMQHPHGRAPAGLPARIIPGLVFAATLAAFWPSLSCGFVDLDDTRLITENPDFRGLSWDHLRWMFSATLMGHWQPLTWLSYAFDFSIAGIAPRQFHLTNILLHAANAALLYFLIARLLRADDGDQPDDPLPVRLGAAAGAVLWSLHPLRVESVTWATERRDVLSGLLLLATGLAYLRAFAPGSVRTASRGWYAASVLLLALSLMAKAWGMSFFVIAIVLDWYPLHRLPPNPLRWLRRPALAVLAQKLPYLVLGLVSARIAGMAQHSSGAMRALDDWPLSSRIAQTFYGLVFYPWKTIWPSRLCALYELRHGLNPLEPQYVVCYGVVAAAAVAIALLHRRAPWLAAAALVYAISLAPVLGLVQSGDQFVADRYSYIACMSWSVLAAGLLAVLMRRAGDGRRAIAFGVPILIAAAFVRVTLAQIPTWSNPVSLWRQAWESDPSRMVPHVNYGFALEARARELEGQGRKDSAQPLYDEALDHYRTATQLQPRDGRGWFPLGNALKRKRDLPGAEAAYREAAKYLPQAYLPLVNLGYLLEQDPARRDEALAAFRHAVEAVEHPRPGSAPSAKPYLSLGLALKNRGDTAGARAAFSRGLELATQYSDTDTAQQARGQLAALGPPK